MTMSKMYERLMRLKQQIEIGIISLAQYLRTKACLVAVFFNTGAPANVYFHA